MALTKVTYSMIDGACINVLDFGAVGDGVANDTAAFQAAIDAGTADTIYVPFGTYLLDPVMLRNEITIIGDGYNSVLKANSTTGILCNNATVPSNPDMVNVEILNLRFTGEQSKAIYQSDMTAYSAYFQIKNCYFDGNLSECIYGNFLNTDIIENQFGYYTGPAAYNSRHIYAVGTATRNSNMVRIIGNHFQRAVGPESIHVEIGEMIIIEENTFETNRSTCLINIVGIINAKISKNWFEDNTNALQIIKIGTSYVTANPWIPDLIEVFQNRFATILGIEASTIVLATDESAQLDFYNNWITSTSYYVMLGASYVYGQPTNYATTVLRNCYGNIYFSNLNVSPRLADQIAVGTPGHNMIVNGGMEENRIWTPIGPPTAYGRTSAQAHSGTYSWYYTVNDALQGVFSLYNLQFHQGKIYRLSFWVYPTSTQDVTVQVTGRASVDTPGPNQTFVRQNISPLTNNAWNSCTLVFTAPITAGNCDLQFVSNVGQTSGTWYIDDVVLQDVSVSEQNGGIEANFSNASNRSALSGGSGTLQVEVPANSLIKAVQLIVESAITGSGASTWTATFSGGSSTVIKTGGAFAKNTKYNIFLTPEVSSALTNIVITPDAGTFTGGRIRAIVQYDQLLTLPSV